MTKSAPSAISRFTARTHNNNHTNHTATHCARLLAMLVRVRQAATDNFTQQSYCMRTHTHANAQTHQRRSPNAGADNAACRNGPYIDDANLALYAITDTVLPDAGSRKGDTENKRERLVPNPLAISLLLIVAMRPSIMSDGATMSAPARA
jgi:hypothetical protein